MKTILLTFDVEEFDLPREFGQKISEKESFEISNLGLNNLFELIEKDNIKATFFTTTNFAKKFPNLIKQIIAQGHEIASHGYSHSDNYLSDISKIKLAKQELEKITKTKIKGFRAPRFAIKNVSKLHDFGFEYDSSLHPTFIPGRYNNLNKKRNTHKVENIIEIPISTLSIFRLPIFWLAFKNSPSFYHNFFTKINFNSSDYTMLVFHPWEFTDLSEFNIPSYIKKNPIEKLKKYLLFCRKKAYNFKTIQDYLNL